MKRILLLAILLTSLTAQGATQTKLTKRQIKAKCITNKTKKQTFICIQDLAKQGNTMTQFTLGRLYYTGQGTIQSYTDAVYWFTQSAKQGYAYAQSVLGEMYYTGQGVKQNYKEALYWYSQAAKQGLAEVQFRVANMYEQGQGTAENKIKAYAWYSLSVSYGDKDSQTASYKLKKTMTDEEIKQAQALATQLGKESQDNLATQKEK